MSGASWPSDRIVDGTRVISGSLALDGSLPAWAFLQLLFGPPRVDPSSKCGSVWVGGNLVADVTGYDFDTAVEVIDDTALDDEAQVILLGRPSTQGRIDCHWNMTDLLGQKVLQDAFNGQAIVALDLNLNEVHRYRASSVLVRGLGIGLRLKTISRITLAYQVNGGWELDYGPGMEWI